LPKYKLNIATQIWVSAAKNLGLSNGQKLHNYKIIV